MPPGFLSLCQRLRAETVCVVDASTPVGRTIAERFTGLLAREVGDDAVTVGRADELGGERGQTRTAGRERPSPAGFEASVTERAPRACAAASTEPGGRRLRSAAALSWATDGAAR